MIKFPEWLHVVCFGAAVAFAMPALAAPPTKAVAERGGHVLVWDYGTTPGVVDAGDDLTDLDRPCNRSTHAEVLGRLANLGAPTIPTRDREALVARLGLRRGQPGIVDARVGSAPGPVYLIFPEVHLIEDPSPGNVRVHRALTTLTIELTEALLARRANVLAAVESVRRPWTSALNLRNVTDGQRAYFARSIVENHKLSGAEAIGELYLESVRTTFVDDAELTARFDAAHVAARLVAKADFDPAVDHLPALERDFANFGDAEGLDRFGLRAYFVDLLRRPRADVLAAEDELCERRSVRMIEAAAADARASSPPADVVYLQIGVSHVHGVRRYLRDAGASYLVFSPDLPRRK